MAYDLNLFNATNATNYLHLVQGVNAGSAGIFGVLILITTFLFFLLSLKRGGATTELDNWVISSFLTILIAALLFFIGLLAWYWVMAPFSLLIVTLIIKFFS